MTTRHARKILGHVRRHLSRDARVGIDLVEVDPFRSRFEGREQLLQDVFTVAELEYARSRPRPWLHLAARLAAKEAAFKAVGCGVTGAVSWRDVEVGRDEAGQPTLAVTGELARLAGAAGVHRFAVSLSHGREYAVAVVVAFAK